MFGLGGGAGYLFRPLAEAVVFALIASYILSRTLVPTLANYLLRKQALGPHADQIPDPAAQTAHRAPFARRSRCKGHPQGGVQDRPLGAEAGGDASSRRFPIGRSAARPANESVPGTTSSPADRSGIQR